MTGLILDWLPDLPQRHLLAQLASDLWEDLAVAVLWLGGSLAQGTGDAHSDVDLRVALAPPAVVTETIPASARRLSENIACNLTRRIADDAVLHHMLLGDGQIYDLWIQTAARNPSEEVRLVLGCRDSALASRLDGGKDPSIQFPPADPEGIRQVIGGFWMSQRKNQKVLARGLTLIVWEGKHRFRQDLLRLWYVLETGNDCGPLPPMTIHSLTPLVRTVEAACGGTALSRLRKSSETEGELQEAAGMMCVEAARAVRRRSARLGFEYPGAAEEAVINNAGT